MLAIVETGGKQYQVSEGRYVDVELLDVEVEKSLTFDKIVMIVAGDQTQVGQPYVEGATVDAKILSHGKEAKVLVYKQRCKKGYRKKQGHRQNYSRVMIESINFPGKENLVVVTEEAKPAKKAKTTKAEGTKKTAKTTEKAETAEKAKAPAKAKTAAKPKKAETEEKVEEVKPVETVETVETVEATEEAKTEE